MKVYDFRELEVYKLAFELQQEIFELSKAFPKEEEYSLTIHWLHTALACGYFTNEEHDEIVSRYEKVGKMLGMMIRDAEKWSVGR